MNRCTLQLVKVPTTGWFALDPSMRPDLKHFKTTERVMAFLHGEKYAIQSNITRFEPTVHQYAGNVEITINGKPLPLKQSSITVWLDGKEMAPATSTRFKIDWKSREGTNESVTIEVPPNDGKPFYLPTIKAKHEGPMPPTPLGKSK